MATLEIVIFSHSNISLTYEHESSDVNWSLHLDVMALDLTSKINKCFKTGKRNIDFLRPEVI